MAQGYIILDCEGTELDFCELSEPLYKSVISRNYDVALTISRALHRSHNGKIIAEVVKKLLENNNGNVLAFGYKLKNGGLKQAFNDHFPKELKLILNKENIKLINKRDGLAVKLALEAEYNDKECLGDSKDKTSSNVSWKFVSVCDDDRMFFKIVNTDSNRYMKLEVKNDQAGDHIAWGAIESDTDRHLWYLDPVMSNGVLLFYIYNKQYGQALKLGRATNEVGDRILWGHNGAVTGNPEKFGWIIEAWDC
ncbi:hypothetical protein K1T71_008901 [Dendrolimus kikuchii]|uniref:Uncharacterized protein n=1 Tax=Dendrolimus kikuchii TaxID=765133 RepID=A0ACC1CVW3_9NEOP|nr:hypothetical protein K1T71_008901 [Dendrolimus kikuchii]